MAIGILTATEILPQTEESVAEGKLALFDPVDATMQLAGELQPNRHRSPLVCASCLLFALPAIDRMLLNRMSEGLMYFGVAKCALLSDFMFVDVPSKRTRHIFFCIDVWMQAVLFMHRLCYSTLVRNAVMLTLVLGTVFGLLYGYSARSSTPQEWAFGHSLWHLGVAVALTSGDHIADWLAAVESE